MRLYTFEPIDTDLSLLPLAARRALDGAGLRLSLREWQRLPSARRRELAACGSEASIDVARVTQLLEGCALEQIAPLVDPDSEAPPADVLTAFAPHGPIPPATWVALEPLDRYVLWKLSHAKKATETERLRRAYEEIIGASATSSHLMPAGGVRMVGVQGKQPSQRIAIAESRIHLSQTAFEQLANRTAAKGDVLATARVAAIQAAKKTPELIPLCHQIALTKVEVDFDLRPEEGVVLTRVTTHAVDRTGVEMEALTAASIASLTIYDMLKSQDRAMEIGPTRLVAKRGGRTGDFQR